MAIKKITGTVVSNRMSKTITVAVQKKKIHKKYHKVLSKTKKYYAHDEHNQYQVGDIVKVQETRPISKKKCWIVIHKFN